MDQAATQTLGTPKYMAPEMIAGSRFDARADLYSLGVVLYELLCGRTLFPEGDVAYHHVHTLPKLPSEWRPEIPAELDQLIEQLLAKDPNQRVQSAQLVEEKLRLIVAH
jgi:serine/threonine-protein kinase